METPEWTPLFEALEHMDAMWKNPSEATDDLIFAVQDVLEAWEAYRQARFGNVEVSRGE